MHDKKDISAREATLIVQPYLKGDKRADASRTLEGQVSEATGLAEAISLHVVATEITPLSEIRPATYLGSGKVETLGLLVEEKQITLAIVNAKLSPVQQRNLETAWKCKVIDRTALILEIFASRARTKEGKLQVELAALEYQKSRLVRSWTHLERQRGGFGMMGGPGETQIESDRRMISDRIAKIRKQLETVTRTRELHRKSRRSIPYPIVALVGYTNAGKSTLFNRLTGANVMAANKLFATLDPAMRAIKLPSGKTIILSDTVGFVSELPTELIAAFRATLEELVEADLLLHVRDIAHEDTEAQKQDVLNVLHSLKLDEKIAHNTIEVLNKIDLLDVNLASEQLAQAKNSANCVVISAETGKYCDYLLGRISEKLEENDNLVDVTLHIDDGKTLAWIYEHAHVIQRTDSEDHIDMQLSIIPKHLAQLRNILKVEEEEQS